VAAIDGLAFGGGLEVAMVLYCFRSLSLSFNFHYFRDDNINENVYVFI
jgi:hypothetical protein